MSEELINSVSEEQRVPEEQFCENTQAENTIIQEVIENVQPIEEETQMVTETVAEEVSEEALEDVENVTAAKDYSSCTLVELVTEFTRLMEAEDKSELLREGENIRKSFYKILNQAKEKLAASGVVETMEIPEEVAFKKLYTNFKGLRAEYQKKMDEQREKNLLEKLAIIEGIKGLVEKQEDINHTFQEFNALQAKWKEIGSVPPAKTKDVWDSYQHARETFYDYIKISNELRDLDFKKNLEIKQDLCAKAAALVEENNAVVAFRKLQKLHEEWREAGPVSRDLREELWNNFKTSTAAINKRYQEYFDKQKVIQKENFEAKAKLCEQTEAIANEEITDINVWNKRSQEIENIQAQWKKIGFASKKENQRIYDRFRAACDKFYIAKREFYAALKSDLQDNYDKKVALCEQAEALSDSTEWRRTSDLLINLQKQWKEIGPVSRRQSDAIWKRFRAACDKFFTAKASHFTGGGSFEENLKAKKEIIEAVLATDASQMDEREQTRVVREFQEKWNAIGFVPMKDKAKIQKSFKDALEQTFEQVKLTGGRQLRIETKSQQVRNEHEKLVAKYRQMEQDIAVWENNIGFIAKSKSASKLVSDIEAKIAKAKVELQQLSEKIKEVENQSEE